MKIVFTFLLLLLSSVKVWAEDAGLAPEALIQNIFALAQKENPLANPQKKAELDGHFDFHQMSLNILGDEAKKRAISELTWFENSIKEIITKTVYPKAPEFLRNVKITYKNTILDGDKATVPSVISKRGEKTDVNYTLLKSGTSWKIIDIAIDEQSWVKTINEKLVKSFKEKGWSGVKELLNKRIRDLNNNKKK